jgi:hypothetical protein
MSSGIVIVLLRSSIPALRITGRYLHAKPTESSAKFLAV